MSAKAAIEIRDVLHVWIEFRAPKKGDLAWAVPADTTPAEALEHVLVGRDVWSAGEAGFGYRAMHDTAEFEEEHEGDDILRTRNIVVHVEYVRTEPRLDNVISHIKLL